MENWTLVLSIIGAAAWIPFIVVPIINIFQKIHINLLEYRSLSNGLCRAINESQYRSGVIIMLVINMFIKNVDYYPEKVKTKIILKDKSEYNAELSDISNVNSANDDGTFSYFCPPYELEFNVSRTIRKNIDNVKFISFFVEGINELNLIDIDTIVMEFYSGFLNKKVVVIDSDQFPSFNGTNIIKQYEKILDTNEINNPELKRYMNSIKNK